MNNTFTIIDMAWPLYAGFWTELDKADDTTRSHMYIMALCGKGKSKHTGMHVIRALVATGGIGMDIDAELENARVPEWTKSALRGESFADTLAALQAEQPLCRCPHCDYIQLEQAGQRGVAHPRFA